MAPTSAHPSNRRIDDYNPGVKSFAVMNAEGRLTIPSAIRKELGIEGEASLEVEAVEGVIVMRPAVLAPLEDAWAYEPEHRALLRRAREDARSGRVRSAPEVDFETVDQ